MIEFHIKKLYIGHYGRLAGTCLSSNFSLKATSASWYASGQSKQLWGNRIIGTKIHTHTLYGQAAVMLDVFHWHHDTGRFCPAPDRGRFWPISALDSNLRCNILGPDGRPWRLFVNWGWGLISSKSCSLFPQFVNVPAAWCLFYFHFSFLRDLSNTQRKALW